MINYNEANNLFQKHPGQGKINLRGEPANDGTLSQCETKQFHRTAEQGVQVAQTQSESMSEDQKGNHLGKTHHLRLRFQKIERAS